MTQTDSAFAVQTADASTICDSGRKYVRGFGRRGLGVSAVALAQWPCSHTGGTRDGVHGSIDGFAAIPTVKTRRAREGAGKVVPRRRRRPHGWPLRCLRSRPRMVGRLSRLCGLWSAFVHPRARSGPRLRQRRLRPLWRRLRFLVLPVTHTLDFPSRKRAHIPGSPNTNFTPSTRPQTHSHEHTDTHAVIQTRLRIEHYLGIMLFCLVCHVGTSLLAHLRPVIYGGEHAVVGAMYFFKIIFFFFDL